MELNSYTKKLNKLIYSVVALCLMLLLLFTATYAWLSHSMASKVNSEQFITIDADAGLEMNYGDEDMNDGTININNVVKEGFLLRECSSVDGRQLFFPLSGYNPDQRGVEDDKADQEFVNDAITKDFLFRPATVKDKNVNYISVDLSLYSNEDIPVWLSNDTKIEGQIASAIRIAFIENEPNGKYVIFDNSEQGFEEMYTGVASIMTSETVNADGSVNTIGSINSTATYKCKSIESYTFDNPDGNVLFTLKGGVEKKITVNIWLEGTDAQCTNSLAGLSDLDIFIKFSTSSEDTKPYYFIDHTLEQWVDDDDCYVFAIDQKGKKQPMRKSDNYETDHTWIVELASSNKPVQFARYNPELQENTPQEWNLWESGDPGTCTTYNAFAHNTGIWDDNFTGTTITFFDAMSDHLALNESGQSEVHVAFTTQDGNGNDIDYEYKMSYQYDNKGTDDYSDDIDYKKWRIVIPSDVTNITFNSYFVDPETGEITIPYLPSWENTERGTNTYFSANEYGGGYWSDRVLLVDSSEGGYADVGGDTIWVAYFFDGGTEIGWTAMNGKTAEGRYIAGIPEGATQVIFCRYADSGYFDWECVYNQTNDLTFGTNNLYKVSGYDGNNNVTGTWHTTSNID